MMKTLLPTVLLFAAAMVCLALGAILRGRGLRGSCGGPRPVGSEEPRSACGHCTCQSLDARGLYDRPAASARKDDPTGQATP